MLQRHVSQLVLVVDASIIANTIVAVIVGILIVDDASSAESLPKESS